MGGLIEIDKLSDLAEGLTALVGVDRQTGLSLVVGLNRPIE